MPKNNWVCSSGVVARWVERIRSVRLSRSIVAAIVVVAHVAAGCAIVDNEDPRGLPGYVSFGYEVSAFYPCDSSAKWWVESSHGLGLFENYDAIASQDYEPVYARLRGSLSQPGQYGHLGQYQGVLAVSEILELRLPVDSDCQWLGPILSVR